MNIPARIYTITSGTIGMGSTTTVALTVKGLCDEMDTVMENPYDRNMVREHLNLAIINNNLQPNSKKMALVEEDEIFPFEKFMRICPSEIGWGWESEQDGMSHFLNICVHNWNTKYLDVDTPEGYFECEG